MAEEQAPAAVAEEPPTAPVAEPAPAAEPSAEAEADTPCTPAEETATETAAPPGEAEAAPPAAPADADAAPADAAPTDAAPADADAAPADAAPADADAAPADAASADAAPTDAAPVDADAAPTDAAPADAAPADAAPADAAPAAAAEQTAAADAAAADSASGLTDDIATPAPPKPADDGVVHQYPSLAGYVEPAEAATLKDARLAARNAIRVEVAEIKANQKAIAEVIAKQANGGTSKATVKMQTRIHTNAIKEHRAQLAALKATNADLKQKRIELYLPFSGIFATAQRMVEDRLRNQSQHLSSKWKAGALGMATKTYGPVGVPLSMASTKKVLNDDATFDTPYDAATFFLVMVLRNQLRGGKLAMQWNHKLLCKVLHPDCQFDRKVADHREQRVRMASMRLVNSCSKTVASFFVGATPDNGYTYDEADLRVAFDYVESGAAGYTNTEAAEFTAHAITSGAMPLYPHARPIKLKYHAGGWRVYLFNAVATAILPANGKPDERESKYTAADLAYTVPVATTNVQRAGAG